MIAILSIFKSKVTWIVLAGILLSAVGMYGYNLYRENQELKFQKQIVEQNSLALEDSLTKARDSVQTMTAFVGNLNSKNGQLEKDKDFWEGKYRATKTDLDIAIATIQDSGEAHFSLVGDSAIVEFEGKQGIASYEGKTILNLNTVATDYAINITFDDIAVVSELFKDVDGMWKTRTTSLTPGIVLRGISTVDDNTLRKLSGVEDRKEENHYFGIGLAMNVNYLEAGIRIKPNRWMFGVDYKIADKLKYEDESSWLDKLRIAVFYFPF